MSTCPFCEQETKATRGQGRITTQPVWMCEHCHGRLPRPEKERGRRPRSPRNNRRNTA